MRNAVVGTIVGAGLAVVAAGGLSMPGAAMAQRTGTLPATASTGLISHSISAGEQRQQLTVIDPSLQTVCVYHIDVASGEISLKSVRNIHWDLQMSDFNTASPLPREIRAMHQK